MSEIPKELFDNFYDSLVGTDEQTQALREDLTERIRTRKEATDPYDALGDGVWEGIHNAAPSHTNPGATEAICSNGIFGLWTTIIALRALDEIYTAQATVPQEIVRINQNANRALLHVYGIAFGNKHGASVNLGALLLGKNPQRPLQAASSYACARFNPRISARKYADLRSFLVEKDPDGQLTIEPAFRNRKPSPKATGCPAAFSRVESGGRERTGLLTLMKVVSDTTVAEIYPLHFPVQDTAPIV